MQYGNHGTEKDASMNYCLELELSLKIMHWGDEEQNMFYFS
jgi:hypothetical protein